MKVLLRSVTVLVSALLASGSLFAQHIVSAKLTDSYTGEAVGFATVSLTHPGAKKVSNYALSSESGAVHLENVRSGEYVLKIELLGYKNLEKNISVKADMDLGELKMDPDTQMLDAASVSAAGNAILVKKDTIEYNASSFKTVDNDVLEDLLKKLPGVEVGEDGSISVNGETISKITIDGKTFFLDDPQLASKNIPAKIINKLKVINKKSEQAEFTGIDDGEEEKVIDISIKPGMMKGAFGNVMGGAGHDLPSADKKAAGAPDDWRWQGAAFVGKFTNKQQLSVILNGNNTNDRGFNDLSGSMMGNMRGGQGGMGGGQGGWGSGNGITTSWMAGANGSWTLFDDKMELNGNYLYNNTDKDVTETQDKRTYLDDSNLLYHSEGASSTRTDGHRIGIRMDHKFSDNTSVLFEPRINWGGGSFNQSSRYHTLTDSLDGAAPDSTNRGESHNWGDNRNVTASGFALFRQRLGIPGRTFTMMGRYSFSHNELDSRNISNIMVNGDSGWEDLERVNQTIGQVSDNTSLFARATYTEPLGGNFYVEANYRVSWSKSESDKDTWDNILNKADSVYSNKVVNESTSQEIGFNFMYQKGKSRAQAGFSAMPTKTHNYTRRYNSSVQDLVDVTYDNFQWRFSPRLMAWWEFSENANARVFYRGSSNQPSTSKLMPVPDNTDPLNVSFGNLRLKPYFTHSLRGDVRYNNKKTFASFNIRFNGEYNQSPIVNASWYSNGAQYSMPFNGPDAANAGLNGFANIPLGRSRKFTLSNFTRINWSKSSSYIGSNIDMTTYDSGDYSAFMYEIARNFADEDYFKEHFVTNTIENLSGMERLRLTYRNDALELNLQGRTRVNRSWYSISKTASRTTTWNNQLRGGIIWTWERPGITFKGEGNYNWYEGYSTDQPSEVVVDAEIQKTLFKKKFTLSVKCYDIFDQAKNYTVTDASNYHLETVNNTLGRYIIASLTYRFGTFDRSKMRGPGGYGGPGGPGRGPR